ncbi:pathogenesis-related thaumatin superfamily protein, partial [Striga asiatica]
MMESPHISNNNLPTHNSRDKFCCRMTVIANPKIFGHPNSRARRSIKEAKSNRQPLTMPTQQTLLFLLVNIVKHTRSVRNITLLLHSHKQITKKFINSLTLCMQFVSSHELMTRSTKQVNNACVMVGIRFDLVINCHFPEKLSALLNKPRMTACNKKCNKRNLIRLHFPTFSYHAPEQ